MTREELIARAEDLVAAWNQADVDRIVSAFCAESRQRVRVDAETLLERYSALEVEILRTVASDNVVTMQWVARAGHNGRQLRRTGVIVADYDISGRIAGYSSYLEPEEATSA